MEAELSADRNTMALGYKVGGLHKGSTEQHNTEQYCGVVRGARALGWHSRLSAASCGVLPVVVQGLRVPRRPTRLHVAVPILPASGLFTRIHTLLAHFQRMMRPTLH
jgi:hypothetical protein